MTQGVLMLDLKGLHPDSVEIDRLSKPSVGGVILFSRNYQDADQLRQLVADIRSVRPDMLIAVDQEGGRVQRFRGEPFTRLPPMGVLGQLYQSADQLDAVDLARECGWLMASEVRAFDIDLSLAPVLDLDRGLSRAIGDRSFGALPESVTPLANAFIEGMREVGMAATGKHFPGHGGVSADSHTALPRDTRTLEEIETDLRVFKVMIEQGLEAVMPAHVAFAAVDNVPAGFSPYWLQTVLRDQLGFEGVIFSDCLNMAAASISGGFPARAEAALQAGCDMVLVCNNPDGAQEVSDWLELEPREASPRLSRLRAAQAVDLNALMRSERRQACRKRLEALVNEGLWR
ncbi:beta-N-acetylhexosaminidase [Kistimonas asteriae]|uniref:beta-N-acetylhexosaminidase n=1 Tax=Kistimonas asteriae TaxID=517724 RepID=UPI001BA457AA|nr:beta-N-acetylhexosaminidase [Kistimonas asteriae]